MCMSVRPSEMSNTKIYVGEAVYNEKYVHVLAYQNKAKTNEPNAMVLPLFTKEKVTENNVVDTSSFKDMLDLIFKPFTNEKLSRGLSFSASKALVFTSGSYTIILADNINEAVGALEQVPKNKRPIITKEFTESFGNVYSDYPVAICCWDGSITPEPLLWWYEPIEKDALMVPTMDSHDGHRLKVNVQVKMDHSIAVGSAIEPLLDGHQLNIDINSRYNKLMPISAKYVKINGSYVNGDCMASLVSLKKDKKPRLYKPYSEKCKIAQNYFDLI